MALKIIGAGLARTGTMSLKLALEQLENGRCFHMIELLKDPSRLKHLDVKHLQGSTDWNAFFAGYVAATDYPACYYYNELLDLYPEAKVILTIRDPESWYESVLTTVYRGKPKGAGDVVRLIRNLVSSADMRRTAPVFMYNDKLIWRGHFNNRFEDKAAAIAIYEAHIAAVTAHVPADRLLVYEVKEGWEPLCDFLGKAAPQRPFPHSNQKVEFNRKMDRLLVDGVFEP